MPSRSAAVVKPSRVDELAVEFHEKQLLAQKVTEDLLNLRARLVALVQRHGQVPARATKTLALAGDKYELRVSTPLEITVDTRAALRIKSACLRGGAGRLWMRLFRTVKTFVLADGADKLLNETKLPEGAPRNLRSLFARAVRVRELAPQVEIREIGKEK
jgi:hypothetical protein